MDPHRVKAYRRKYASSIDEPTETGCSLKRKHQMVDAGRRVSHRTWLIDVEIRTSGFVINQNM